MTVPPEPEPVSQSPLDRRTAQEVVGRLASKDRDRYERQGEFARGGMGVLLKVWDADLSRFLAMKMLHATSSPPASSTPKTDADERLLARFLEEAEITGQLDHPGIVPVHELGLDAHGNVYFTMKLVQGRDLQQTFALVFAQRDGWSETRALSVLLKVCEAMAYAHKKGVIHRDLKPANVMVGEFGEVYVMDWGLARVLGRHDAHDVRIKADEGQSSVTTVRRTAREESPDSPLVTMDGDVVGTPSYMSPEQARGEVDKLSPRSDVYAVGAMLYHLLARRAPYVPLSGNVSPLVVLGLVLQDAPAPLKTVAPSAPPELVAICDKAMAREPENRYQNMLALAEDLRAFLEDRVVRAYRTGALVELRKWVRRNRPFAATIAAAVLLLLAGSTFWVMSIKAAEAEAVTQSRAADAARAHESEQRRRAEANAEAARSEAARANAVMTLIQTMLGAANPHQLKGPSYTVRELLDDFSDDLSAVEGQPAVEAAVRTTIGTAYLNLELFDRAKPHLEKALALRVESLGHEDEAVAESLAHWAMYQHHTGDFAGAEKSLREVLAICEARFGAEHERTARVELDLADVLSHQGQYAAAEALGRKSLAIWRVLPRGETGSLGDCLANLGETCRLRGNLQVAESLLREALDVQRRWFGPEHPVLASTMNNLALALQQRRAGEAVSLFEKAIAMHRKFAGRDDASLALMLNNLGMAQAELGQYQQAQANYREALELQRRELGDEHVVTARIMNNLALALAATGDRTQAKDLIRQVLALQRKLLSNSHPDVGITYSNLAEVLWGEGNNAEAERVLRECLSLWEDDPPDDPRTRANVMIRIGILGIAQRKFEDAERFLIEAYDSLSDVSEGTTQMKIQAVKQLVGLYGQWRRPEEQSRWRAILAELENEGG